MTLRFEKARAKRNGHPAWKLYRGITHVGYIEHPYLQPHVEGAYAFSVRGYMPTFTAAELHQIAEFITSQDG